MGIRHSYWILTGPSLQCWLKIIKKLRMCRKYWFNLIFVQWPNPSEADWNEIKQQRIIEMVSDFKCKWCLCIKKNQRRVHTANNFQFMHSQIYNWPNLTPKHQQNISKQNFNILSRIMLFFTEVKSLVDYHGSLSRYYFNLNKNQWFLFHLWLGFKHAGVLAFEA
jgi:hypothetical protein